MNVTQLLLPAGLQFDPLLFSGVRWGLSSGHLPQQPLKDKPQHEKDILSGTLRPFECSYLLGEMYSSLCPC